VTDGSERAITYTTVYLIERSLSLDNLFVFLLLFAYFGTPVELRARLLFFGIIFALILRGLAILGGVALIEQFHWIVYILGVLLLLLAWRILGGVEEAADPDRNVIVRGVRKVLPVTNAYRGDHWFVRVEDGRERRRGRGRLYATPLFVCLAAIVASDIAFAVDSIPAAFAITRDQFVIWMANVFALLGLRALFVLVEGLIKRFRYLDETIAVVLAIVGIKLLIEDAVKVGPVASLLIVLAAFAVGMVASLVADAREGRSGDGPGDDGYSSSSTSTVSSSSSSSATSSSGSPGAGDRVT
jgi:tellurite resistance protein TerC